MQPGDVFLVQLPIDKQQAAYKEKGFLPLDQLIYRIHPRGYVRFYERSFAVGGEGKLLPEYWLAPGKSPKWSEAPSAKFPTYTFSVRSGGGFNLAVPVQGVPIGLSLMGADGAEGTITIGDAYTYGVDAWSLYGQVQEWARENQDFLAPFAVAGDKPNYLRVVTRVYATNQLNMSLKSASQMAAGATAGLPRPIDLIVPKAGADQDATLAAYEKNIKALNGIIETALAQAKGVLPGGTLKVASASAGSISLIETFTRPLVIGYIGFDAAIRPGGVLDPPFPTYAALEGTITPATSPVGTLALLSNADLALRYRILEELKRQGDQKAGVFAEELDKVAGRFPGVYPCNIWALSGGSGSLVLQRIHRAGEGLGGEKRTFREITGLRAKVMESIKAIQHARANPAVTIQGSPEEKGGLAGDLKANEDALNRINEHLRENAAIIAQAADYAISRKGR